MDEDYYGHKAGDFRPGQRVELHPATDLRVSGVRYGNVVRVGRTRVHIRCDRLATVKLIDPRLIRPVLL